MAKNDRLHPKLRYVLCNQRMHDRVISMVIDEGRTRCKLPDHNLITVTLKIAGGGNEEGSKKWICKLDKSEVAMLTSAELRRRLIDGRDVSYKNLVKLIKRYSQGCKTTILINQKYAKWSVEIRELDRVKKLWGRKLRDARRNDSSEVASILEAFKGATSNLHKQIAAVRVNIHYLAVFIIFLMNTRTCEYEYESCPTLVGCPKRRCQMASEVPLNVGSSRRAKASKSRPVTSSSWSACRPSYGEPLQQCSPVGSDDEA